MIKNLGFTRFLHSLNWQHKLCKNPKPKPDMETLFVDHICNQPIAASPAISHPNIAAEVLSPHGVSAE